MTQFSRFQVPPPSNWQDFESLCCDLWRAIWKDPNTQKNGRQGQPQHGVDIFGKPDQGNLWAGVQCKGKDKYADKSITENEVETEVEKAKSFSPPLSQFVIATSGKRDVSIQELARKITEKHLGMGLFSVHVWCWEDIVGRLEEFPHIIAEYYPGLSIDFKALKKEIDEVKENTQAILENTGDIKSSMLSIPNNLVILDMPSYVDISSTILTSEHQAEIDHSRDLLKNYNPVEALDYLEGLKSRIWSSAQPIVKYRILTNIGAAKGLLNRHQESARLLIEALQYNPDDEKALCNAALGYLLLGILDQAVVYANKVLKTNPSNGKAYSVIVRAASDDESLDEIVARVPEPYRSAPEVANAISYLFRKKENFPESRKWLETAIDNDATDSPELKADLGTVLMKLVTDDQSTFFGIQINDEKRAQIAKSIELLTSAWNRVANTSIRDLRLDWIANRGLAKRLFGDLDGAIEDIETALEADRSDPAYSKYMAMLLREKGENGKAITLLTEIIESGALPEAALLLGEVLREENKFPEAIEIIKKLLEGDSVEAIKEEACRLLIRLYIDTKDFPNAKDVLSSLQSKDPANISYLVDAARIAAMSGERDEALSLLTKAKNHINGSTTFRQLLEIADEFYAIKEFEEAAFTYERIVDKTLDTPLSRRLLNSYYRAGELNKALEICKNLQMKYGVLEYVSEMESAIYEEIGDLPKAKEICKTYLGSFPDDSGMKLRLAVINLRSNDLKELDEFLDSPFDIQHLPLDHRLQFAGLLAARNRYRKAFEVIYETRRTFYSSADAHLKYMGFFLEREKDVCDWLNITQVGVDTAVCIEEDSHGREWYIIEDRKDADKSRREFDLNHPLVKKMLGKTVGDDIVTIDSPYSKVTGKIVEIKSKYVYAFQESLSSFEKLFPDATGAWKVKVGIPAKEGALPEGFETVFDEVSRQHERALEVERFYREGKLTIGAFANLIGRSVLDVWGGLINNPDLGVICCIGSTEERILASSAVAEGVKLIADAVSIMTLHLISAGDVIVERFGKLGVAQSTVDLFSHTIDERKGIQSKGFMVVSKEGDKFVRQEISAEDIKRNLEHLEKVTGWVNINCEIIPCKAALNVKREQRQQLEKMIGSSFIETILIASEPEAILYSDDELLRSLAKREFNTDGVWTQVLLTKCLDEGILDRGNYSEMVIQLANHSYRHTSIDAYVLIEAAKQSGWSPRPPYTIVLKALGGQYSNESSALIVGTKFLYELWKQPILAQQRDQTILALLDAITFKRNPRVIMAKLRKLLERRFYLIPLALKDAVSVMNIWEKTHII